MLGGVLQVGAAVVDMRGHPGVLVRMLRVQLAADLHQRGIDLYRVDVPGPLGQRHRHVVSVPAPMISSFRSDAAATCRYG